MSSRQLAKGQKSKCQLGAQKDGHGGAMAGASYAHSCACRVLTSRRQAPSATPGSRRREDWEIDTGRAQSHTESHQPRSQPPKWGSQEEVATIPPLAPLAPCHHRSSSAP